MNENATKTVAEIASRAAARTDGAWVKQDTPAGVVGACTIKKHIAGRPFASFQTIYRLDGKRVALSVLLERLSAV